MPRTKKTKPAQTTAQQLSALIKSVRQILRKDKGSMAMPTACRCSLG